MIWNVCLLLSVSIIVLTVIGLILAKLKFRKTGKSINLLTWLIASTFLAAAIAFIPLYNADISWERFKVFGIIVISLLNSLKLFVIDADFSFVGDVFDNLSLDIEPLYSFYLSILFIVAPMFTFGCVLTFFKNVSAKIKYVLNYCREVYIFS